MIINHEIEQSSLTDILKKEGLILKERLEQIITEVKFMGAHSLFYNANMLGKFIFDCLENLDKSKYVRRNLPRLIGYLYEKNYNFKMSLTQSKILYIFQIYV